MREIEKLIIDVFESQDIKHYLHLPPPNTKYPFLTYSINETYRARNPHLFNLEVDLWDNHNSASRIEDLAESLDNALENANLLGEETMLIVKKQSRVLVRDPDESIKRINLTYQIRMWR